MFEGEHDMIFMLGTGKASSKIIQSVEYLRKRIKGIHVAYEILTTEFNDVYEPLEEKLDKVEIKRQVATLKAHITLTTPDEIKSMPGYMSPLDDKDLLDEETFKTEVENHFSRDRSGDNDDR